MPRSVVAVILGLAFVGSARAQDLDAKALARLVAPYIYDATQGVAHVDVEKVDLKKYFEAFAALPLPPGAAKEMGSTRDFVLDYQRKLLKMGIRHILAVVNVSEIPPQGLPDVIVVAPLSKNAETDELLQLLGKIPGVSAKVTNGTLLARFGGMEAVQPKERPEFAEGLEALKDKHIQTIFSPSTNARQLVEQVVPRLPAQLGGGEITVLTKGVRWLAVGYDTNRLTQQYLVQAKNAQAAKEVKAIVDKGLDAMENLPELADFARVRPLLSVKQEDDRVSLMFEEKSLQAMLQSSVGKVRLAALRTQSQNNLKQIGLAMHNNHAVYNSLPARANFDGNGKPLLSWRVHILPFIGQEELYKQFKLNEPWNSEHNKKLIAQIPPIYASPLSKAGKDGKTTYLALTGKGSMFDGDKGVRFLDVTDGTSNTIMVVEANDTRAVYWTQPEDFPIDTKEPLADLVLPELKAFHAAFGDGSVRTISASIRLETLRALFTRNGGEMVNPDE
jgi:hypothetical protein